MAKVTSKLIMKKLVCIEANRFQMPYTTVVEIANEIECAFVIGFITSSPQTLYLVINNTYAHNPDS